MNIKTIQDIYNSKGRYYHNYTHIQYILEKIKIFVGLTSNEKEILNLAAYYHDIIYNPKSNTNEKDSVEYFFTHETNLTRNIANIVADIILETRSGAIQTTKLSQIFHSLDYGITNESFSTLIQWEKGIFKEYQHIPYNIYKTKRIEFLTTLNQTNNIKNLISYVESFRPKIGLYAGSFNPLHIGHMNIINQAENVFDKVIVAQLNNPLKDIANKLSMEFNEVIVSSKMLHEIVEENSEYADIVVIRGLRNGSDLEYETNLASWVKEFSNVNFVYFKCEKEFEHISSSALRGLKSLNQDISKFTLSSY